MLLAEEPPQPTLSESLVDLGLYSGVSVGQATAPRRLFPLTVPHRVISSYWFKPVIARLATGTALPQGWDSYAGFPTSLASVEKTVLFLSRVLQPLSLPPTVIPLSDGGVQLVWSREGLDVEVTFGADDAELYVRTPDGEFEGDPADPQAVAAFGAIVERLSP